jgi:hypothetical protein
VPGGFGFLLVQGNGEAWTCGLGRVSPYGSFVSMNESKSKKNAPVHEGFEWAGAVARVKRGVRAGRAGRRAALLGMLTAAYANSTRGGRIPDRTNGER